MYDIFMAVFIENDIFHMFKFDVHTLNSLILANASQSKTSKFWSGPATFCTFLY